MQDAADKSVQTLAAATERLTIERRLTAIAFADVAGFSAMIERDDVTTMRQWKALRTELIEPKITEYRGRLIRVIGDALFIEFRSAVDAVHWALDVRRGIEERIQTSGGAMRVRIGINVEDAIVDNDDLHGDGVNIAARIQQLGQPGEIIVTSLVHQYVWNKVGATFTDLGERVLKNIAHRVHVFRVDEPQPGRPPQHYETPHLNWGHRPAIAVLPFRVPVNSPQEAYFGEGITENIIAGLAHSRSLFVIARNSTLGYADRRAEPRQIAAELGVRYLVDGSIQRQGSRLRITTELIDADQNLVIWADRHDGSMENLFDFQERIADRVIGTMQPHLMRAETRRAQAKPTDNLDAYDWLLRALSLFYTLKDEDLVNAGSYLDNAIKLDCNYAQAWAYKAWWYGLLIGQDRSRDVVGDRALASAVAERALELDPQDPMVVAISAYSNAFLRRQPEAGAEQFEQALQLNENSAFAWGTSAIPYCYLGEAEKALENLRNAWRLSPFDPLNFMFLSLAGFAALLAGRYEESVIFSQRSLRANTRYTASMRNLAAGAALAGRRDEAVMAAQGLLAALPDFGINKFMDGYPLRRPDDRARLVKGLRLAGIPE